MQWPDFYPENCPPTEAEPASGTVYRLVRRDPAQPKDFTALFVERPGLFQNKPTAVVCQSCGVSVCKDRQDIVKLQRSSAKINLIIRGGSSLEQNLGSFLM